MTGTHASEGSKSKQLNVRVPDQLHRQLKAKAALDGVSLADAIDDVVRQYIDGKVQLVRKPE